MFELKIAYVSFRSMLCSSLSSEEVKVMFRLHLSILDNIVGLRLIVCSFKGAKFNTLKTTAAAVLLAPCDVNRRSIWGKYHGRWKLHGSKRLRLSLIVDWTQ